MRARAESVIRAPAARPVGWWGSNLGGQLRGLLRLLVADPDVRRAAQTRQSNTAACIASSEHPRAITLGP
jgi:hypothetical protein